LKRTLGGEKTLHDPAGNVYRGPMKTIVITGCTRGLGEALIHEFQKLGHRTMGCGRNLQRIEKLKTAYPTNAQFAALDVTDFEAVENWASAILAASGPPDILINNAGIINEPRNLWEIAPVDFARIMDVNLRGVFHSIKAFAPAMTARKSGMIINLSSGWGRSTSPQVAPYCASKYAIEGMTKALAQELPEGMAAIPLNPGIINTDMLQTCWADGASSYPKAETWAKIAAPYILKLSPKDNGRSVSVPQ